MVVLILATILFWQVFILPGFKKSAQCFTVRAKSAEETYQKAITMSPGKGRNQLICTEDKTSFQSLISCFETTKRENNLGFAVYSSLPTFYKTINETIDSHNKLCPETPLAPLYN